MGRKHASSTCLDSLTHSKVLSCFLAIVLALSCFTSFLTVNVPSAEAATTGKVTSYQKVSSGGTTLGYFTVNNQLAICAEHHQKTPGVGSPCVLADDNVESVDIRKVLYYGYKGPGDLGYSRFITTLALSTANGDYAKKGAPLIEAVKNLPNPSSNFKVCRWVTNGGKTQDLMTWNYAPAESTTKYGHIQVHKSSADPNITNGNANYSLENAHYRIYQDNGDGSGGFVANLYTDANGDSNVSAALPYGNYKFVERVAPLGYSLDSTVYYVTIDESTVDADGIVHKNVTDTPIKAPEVETYEFNLYKVDADSNSNAAQGAASLEGALFEISYVLDEVSYTSTITTDAQGHAKLAVALPEGTVLSIKEIEAPAGYVLNSEPVEFTISDSSEDATANDFYYSNEVIRGGIAVTKFDSITEETAQGDANFEGITFEVVSDNDAAIYVGEQAFEKGAVVATLTTDETGYASTSEDALPYGSYLVRETATNNAYELTFAEQAITIEEDGFIYLVEAANDVVRGDIAITKIDSATGSVAQGAANFEGITFEIINSSENAVVIDGVAYANGEVVATLVTDEEGKAATNGNALPYGTYTVHEKSSNDSYLNTAEDEIVVVSESETVYNVEMANDVIRGDFTFIKVDAATEEPIADVEFLVTSVATGESDVIVSDESGIVSTEPLWFGKTTAFGESDDIAGQEGEAPVSSELGSLPYGTYIVEELSCEANADYELAEPFEVMIDEDGVFIDLGIIGNVLNHKVSITKVDMTNSEELPGATLVLYDSEGYVVDEWVSTEEAHVIEQLAPGSYYLEEIIAPEGYVLSDEIVEIEVTETAAITHAKMVNEPEKIEGLIDKRQTIASALDDKGMGGTYYYTLDFANNSNTWVDEFTVTEPLDCVEDDMARLVSITTPVAFEDWDGMMNVWYQTSRNDKKDTTDALKYCANDDVERVMDYTGWKLWKEEVSTIEAEKLAVKDLKLEQGEYITAVRFEFGRVQAGFTTREADWGRDSLKSEKDNLKEVTSSHKDTFDLADAEGDTYTAKSTEKNFAPAVLEMYVTGRYDNGAVLENSAYVDLYRNADLHDEDSDRVKQSLGEEYDKTGYSSMLLISVLAGGVIAIAAGIGVIFYARKKEQLDA